MKNQEALRMFVFVLHRSAIKIHARTHAHTHTHTHTLLNKYMGILASW
jgi:hypothetical protein